MLAGGLGPRLALLKGQAMNDCNHTPTEWHWEIGPTFEDEEKDDIIAILGPDSHGCPHVWVTEDHKQGGSKIENANFIVRACNNIDHLCDAAEAVVETTERGEDGRIKDVNIRVLEHALRHALRDGFFEQG